jgi:ammonium transporter, Amt family
MNEPNSASLLRELLATETALNIVWTMLAVCLVMFMQAGFALLETGFSRTKNVAHTMALNFLVYSIAVLAFWAFGFGLQMGGLKEVQSLGHAPRLAHEFGITIAGKTLGLFGTSGFFMPPAWFTPGTAALFMFQLVFMATGAIIPTGALIERWKFASFMICSAVTAALIYPIYANWVWGGGFLSSLGQNFQLGHGHVDFAGSSVVHMTGGVLAFVGATLLGPRAGKYGPLGEVRPIPAHNVPMIVTGTYVLAFGWFGFNAGSTLCGTDTHLAVIAFNTMLASAAGGVSGTLHSWRRFDKPDLTMMCNGMLAGLVAITAPCAFVAPWAAAFIGCAAGILVTESAVFVERRLRIDDPVGAISVHGVCGAFGALCVGLFADGSYGEGLNGVAGGVRGLFYGDPGQLIAAMLGVGTNMIWVGTAGALAFIAVDRLVGNRVRLEDEILGLDVAELGMEGYFDGRPASVGRPSEPSSTRLPNATRPLPLPLPLWSTQDPFRR